MYTNSARRNTLWRLCSLPSSLPPSLPYCLPPTLPPMLLSRSSPHALFPSPSCLWSFRLGTCPTIHTSRPTHKQPARPRHHPARRGRGCTVLSVKARSPVLSRHTSDRASTCTAGTGMCLPADREGKRVKARTHARTWRGRCCHHLPGDAQSATFTTTIRPFPSLNHCCYNRSRGRPFPSHHNHYCPFADVPSPPTKIAAAIMLLLLSWL